MQNNHKLTSLLSLNDRCKTFKRKRHGDFEVLEISNNKEIYIEYKSDRKFLIFPHHTFIEEHFSKIMKNHNTFCIEMGACMTARKRIVTGVTGN